MRSENREDAWNRDGAGSATEKYSTVLCAALFSLLVASPAGAQTSVGLISGVNRTRYVAPNDYAEHGSLSRYTLGGVVDVPLTDAIHLRAEPVFIQKGGSAKSTSMRQDLTLRTSMLEVPLLVVLGFGTTTRPYALAGPTLGMVLSSHLAATTGGVPFEGDLADVTKRFEVGLGAGAGLSHDFGYLAGFVEGRYSWGLTNLMKNGEVRMSSLSPGISDMVVSFDEELNRYRFRGLQVLVGLTVPLSTLRR